MGGSSDDHSEQPIIMHGASTSHYVASHLHSNEIDRHSLHSQNDNGIGEVM